MIEANSIDLHRLENNVISKNFESYISIYKANRKKQNICHFNSKYYYVLFLTSTICLGEAESNNHYLKDTKKLSVSVAFLKLD